MSLGPEGFGEQNQSNGDLNDFSDMVRSKSTATTTNFDDEENQSPTPTNKDEKGKLLFPGQHIARRSSLIDAKILQENLQDTSDVPVQMKKRNWDEDDDSDAQSSEDGSTGGDSGSKGKNKETLLKFEEEKE